MDEQRGAVKRVVVRGGVEPPTHGFSVHPLVDDLQGNAEETVDAQHMRSKRGETESAVDSMRLAVLNAVPTLPDNVLRVVFGLVELAKGPGLASNDGESARNGS